MAIILIIDDDDEVRGMLCRMLEQNDYETVEAADGKEAMCLYRKEPADLIITDIIMPGKDGLEVIKEIKKDFPNAKIIAISGGGRGRPETYLEMAYRFGASSIIFKPFTKKEILESVENLLS